MKNKASVLLNKIVLLVSSIAKAKSVASIKSKTSDVNGRLIMLSLVKSKKVLLGSISHKIHSILGQSQDNENEKNQNKAIAEEMMDADDDDDGDGKYPDLTHSLFDEKEEFDDPGGSIIELVKNSKEEGEDFKLEDGIDHVADLFIMRFHKQMRLQKLESFKRFQEMLERSL